MARIGIGSGSLNRVKGAVAKATGANGPAGHDLGLLNEGVIDNFLVNIKNLASASTTVAVKIP